jgi:hypothetical protein
MRYLLIVLLALSFVLADQRVSILGQNNVHGTTWIYFDPGSSDTDSTMKIHISNDTVWADSAGTYVQISGTEDSCSYPFYLTDWSGMNHPIWLQYISPRISGTRTDSNQISYLIETREKYNHKDSFGNYATSWTEWTPKGLDVTDSNIVVTDSINSLATGYTTAIRQKIRFSVTGDQARLCPVIPDEASAGAADTTTYDSTFYIGR